MVSSKQRGSLFDPYRQAFVAATPEEMVRQRLLHLMTEKLGYPKELLAIEKQLSELPHLEGKEDLPLRRADILCFGKDSERFYPLLLIECKEGRCGTEAISQVLGYNHYVQARFVAIAGEGGAKLVYPIEVSFLPSYSQLLEHLCN